MMFVCRRILYFKRLPDLYSNTETYYVFILFPLFKKMLNDNGVPKNNTTILFSFINSVNMYDLSII